MEKHQKVAFVSLPFTGPVDRWYQSYQMGKVGNRWVTFVLGVCSQFEYLNQKNLLVSIRIDLKNIEH